MSRKLTVNGMNFSWPEDGRGLSTAGIDSVLFWTKPSLASILVPLREEVGEDLYSRLIAFEASKGTFEDYRNMIKEQGENFAVGFDSWAHAVSAAGWGRMFLEAVDWQKKEATVRIENPWELRITRATQMQNEVPFLTGKLTGIFSHAFETNIRSEVLSVEESQNAQPVAVLRLRASSKTLEQALLELHSDESSGEGSRLRAANNALRRNERRLLDVADTIGEFIWETDTHLNFTHVTDRASSALGEVELIGKKWSALLAPEEALSLRRMLQNLDKSRPFMEGEFSLVRSSGEASCILLRVKERHDHNGNCIGYVGSGRDITQEKRLQTQVIDQAKNAEFAAKMATLGEMAGGMAHEINTPLAVITLLAEQLTDLVADHPEQREMAQTILETAERIDRIVQGLKTFARDTNDDVSVEVPVAKIVEDTLILCRARFHNHAVELRVPHIPPELTLHCRPTQITQVLLNLLNNAYDAILDRCEKWIAIGVEVSEARLCLRVSDSGEGIPEGVRDKLMQPFFTTKPVGQGTGLGLSISKGIVESHHGQLTYDTMSTNTSFVMDLPRKA